MDTSPVWQTLLTGDVAGQAEKAVRDIAVALEPQAEEMRSRPASLPDASLSGGLPGIALFFYYFSRTLGGDREREIADSCLEGAIGKLGELPMGPSLYRGFSGLAWVTEHLERQDGGDADRNREIDEFLAELLTEGPWTGPYDVIDGLVGLGIYALERLPNDSGAAVLDAVLARLADLANSLPEGIAWRTELGSPDGTADEAGQPIYNLGLSHGIPGVIGLLARVCGAEVPEGTVQKSQALLVPAVHWLLAQKGPPEGVSLFGSTVPEVEILAGTSRLAWCYGDLGIAFALLAAAEATGREDWRQEATTIARHCARRDPETSGVQDAGLCHGAFGLGHLFHRAYRATGDETCATAARSWYARGFDYRQPGQEIAGFPAWTMTPSGEPGWWGLPGFLIGASGVGLALLGAIGNREPLWDRLLLADLAP